MTDVVASAVKSQKTSSHCIPTFRVSATESSYIPKKRSNFKVGSRSIPSPNTGQLLVKINSTLNLVGYKIQHTERDGDVELSPRALISLLQQAIQTHAGRTREAAVGRGIDRHLLGLKLMLEELPVDATTSTSSSDSPSKSGPTDPPQKRTHPLFADSQEWKLSTSGLSTDDQFRGTGFGVGWEDGYGINYLIALNRIKFCVESKFSSPLTSTNKSKQHIADALRDMCAICEAGELELKDKKKKSVDRADARVQARL
ncbi:uncharacterized protein F5891DRAFT_1183308 [Suillus fuscotomentosus]|uniref:Choline/carnitine acyltransferase domain-containing protein n=1 Tax=Suillus fuscotomentosus TaxID=1912939 RepID=A0AAD4EFM2_9AGAM|nr:uncharacterized protein F5891DRAFT_1183308 [Suillus fuscotomentosus]KAG1905364.1 hypothetical protein F5891DRAFT_1183308 [Suillus fuscotomentosus]